MSKETYFDIAAARYAANVLWTPGASVDMLGRDWAVLDGGFAFEMPVVTLNANTWAATTTMETFAIYFPDSWDLDDSFDELEVVVQVALTGSRTSTAATADFDVYISSGAYQSDTKSVSSTSPLASTYTLVFPATAVPQGIQSFSVRGAPDQDGTNVLSLLNSHTTPNCRIFVRYV